VRDLGFPSREIRPIAPGVVEQDGQVVDADLVA
jgi:hypothetical protein